MENDATQHHDHVDLDALIGSWRAAFEAEQHALRAAGLDHDLTDGELRTWTSRLAEERAATVQALSGLARDRHQSPLLARLVSTPIEAKRLLGLPPGVTACVFNVNGVLVPSASVHADAWKELFDGFIARRVERTGGTFIPFSRRADYPTLVHGKTREAAVRDVLASRGISLPEGSPADDPGLETVHGLANRKKRVLLDRLGRPGVNPYEGARLYLELAHDAGLACAVVSGSTNTRALLDASGLLPLADVCVDGNEAAAEGLRRKPAPDMLLAACRDLGADPARAAVFETTPDGVLAGRAGGFQFVVAVGQEGDATALREVGPDLVVTDLGEILEHALAGTSPGADGGHRPHPRPH